MPRLRPPGETAEESEVLKQALESLCCGKDVAVIIGPRVFQYDDRSAVGEALETLAGLPNVNVIPLYFGTNARGALEMGAFPGIGPGPAARPEKGRGLADIVRGAWRPKVIYLAGDVPFLERPDCDFLIVQDIYLPRFKVDVFLPAASFAEAGGTLVNLEGRVQEVDRRRTSSGGRRHRVHAARLANLQRSRAQRSEPAVWNTRRTRMCSRISGGRPRFPAGIDRKPRRMTPLGSGPRDSRPRPVYRRRDFCSWPSRGATATGESISCPRWAD